MVPYCKVFSTFFVLFCTEHFIKSERVCIMWEDMCCSKRQFLPKTVQQHCFSCFCLCAFVLFYEYRIYLKTIASKTFFFLLCQVNEYLSMTTRITKLVCPDMVLLVIIFVQCKHKLLNIYLNEIIWIAQIWLYAVQKRICRATH